MDCNKRFGWDDYLQHTSCVTEAERYQGALYVAKENKGEKKQQDWLGNVAAKLHGMSNGDKQLKSYMERLMAYDNVPRKRTKFINFAKNSLNLKADRDNVAERLWDLIGAKAEEPEAPVSPGAAAAASGQPQSTPHAMASAASTVNSATDVAKVEVNAGNEAVITAKAEEKAAKKAAKAAKKAAKAKATEEANASGESLAEVSAASSMALDAKAEAKAAKKRKRDAEVTADEEPPKLGHGGKRVKGQPQPHIDTLTKPIKWKKIINKELEDAGGKLSLKKLRKACVSEARAHPSHRGRDKEGLESEFDTVLSTFDKYAVADGAVTFAK